MNYLELLAPAKNFECGKAAIDHGADAVYIGAQRFGARAAAGNSVSDIAELCAYAHQFGAKVFVTVNTIIYDDELGDTIKLAHELDNVGVDALLIQDMGLMSLLKEEHLRCHLHASTQTDNRTPEKVAWLREQGFKRVVLARELSIEEIAEIHRLIPDVELEVFVHGALCVSYSGQCYASHYCFNRSANRGECAQFCRLAFNLEDANGQVIEHNRHLLSLRDMAQIDNLAALAEAGAISFKIEGRLKDVDYVKNITAAYSERLNEIVRKNPDRYQRASYGHCTYTFTPDINKSFNRGFTTYFAHGRQHDLVSFDTPKAMGEPVGKVKELRGNSFNVAGTANFSNGDGLCFLDKDRQLIGFRVNRVEGNRLFPLKMPQQLRPGTQLFRNQDHAFSALLSRPSAERKVGISMQLTTTEDSILLHAEDECGRSVEITEPCELQKAEKPQAENIRRQLSKLGGTIFTCEEIKVGTDAFIPSSILADIRRRAINELLAQPVTTPYIYKEGETEVEPQNHYPQAYLYNASNKVAQGFYADQGTKDTTAFETQKNGGSILMQCRYCLRNEMGYCTKNGRKAPWREPLNISLPDGKHFLLEFDCRNCQMNIKTNS